MVLLDSNVIDNYKQRKKRAKEKIEFIEIDPFYILPVGQRTIHDPLYIPTPQNPTPRL